MFMYKRIQELREDNDKTQKEIAILLGTSQQYYSQYESGKREITVERIIKLAKYYKTSTDYILGLTEEKKPYPRKRDEKKWLYL